jgi:hypothetical protein
MGCSVFREVTNLPIRPPGDRQWTENIFVAARRL